MMRFAICFAIAFALACIVSQANVSAHELRQPASVVPWAPAASEVGFVVPRAAEYIPPWILDAHPATPGRVAVNRPVRNEPTTSLLPGVEVEDFAMLGHIQTSDINRYDNGPTTDAQPIVPSTVATDTFRPFTLSRAHRGENSNRRAAQR